MLRKGKRPIMPQASKLTRNAAESLAIQALSYLAEEPARVADFLHASGIAAETIRLAAREPAFLAGVLDHLASNESLVLDFARHAGIDAGTIARARTALGGEAREREHP
jgi:uncharacterized protein DUF3572